MTRMNKAIRVNRKKGEIVQLVARESLMAGDCVICGPTMAWKATGLSEFDAVAIIAAQKGSYVSCFMEKDQSDGRNAT